VSEQTSFPAGWYYAQGDPPGTNRYWDGQTWVGDPQYLDPNQTVATSYAPSDPSPWARVGGRCIDGLIWGGISAVASVTVIIDALQSGFEGTNEPLALSSVVITSLITTVGVVAYEVVLSMTGGTPGKRAAQLAVVKADGSPLDWVTSFRRMLLYIIVQALSFVVAFTYIDDPESLIPLLFSLVFWVIALAGLIMVFATEKARTPWDLVGGTKVVRR
jgi:uncharacterized RDD family membrane protein YckC